MVVIDTFLTIDTIIHTIRVLCEGFGSFSCCGEKKKKSFC